MKEGRQGNPEFNVDVYRSNYGDLQNAFGSNLDKYYWHYIVAGKSEKRNAKTSISGKLTFYQGVNYASVYDTDYYYKNHPDLRRVYGKDPVALLEHFVTWGSKMEGRQGNAEFNPAIYKENYKDLRAAYGNDWKKYYDHYRTWGKSHEARIADKRIVPVMYNGLEYAAVFDADYYYDHNPDLQRAYGHDEKALFKHFAEWGSKVEGRQGNTEFNMNVYKAKNKDLQNAYGDQKEKYYWHYIVAGRREGRIAQ